MRFMKTGRALLLLILVHACSTSPPPPPESVRQAFDLAGNGQAKQALTLLETEEKKHPEDAVYPFYLGRLTARYFNDIFRGEIKFKEVKKLPHEPFGQYLQMKNPDGSIAGYQFKDVTPVLRHYLRAIEKNPRFADAYLEAALLYASLFEIDKGIALLQTASRHMPDNHRFPYLLGYILERIGKPGKAIAAYTRAVNINGDAGEAHLQIGLLRLKTGRTEAAAAALSRVIEIGDNEKDVERALKAYFLHFYKSGLSGDTKALGKAIAWGEKHLEQFRKRPRMMIRLGKACHIAGKKKRALRYLKLGLDEIPIDAQALLFYAELLADNGKTAEAVETYRKSLAIQDRSFTRYMLGSLLVRSGNAEEGLAQLKQAAAVKKEDPEILFAIADALEKANAPQAERKKAWRAYLGAARKKGHNRAGIRIALKRLRESGD